MHRRLRRAALAVTLGSTLFIPAVTSLAGPKDELHQNEQRLDRLRSQINENSAEARTLRADIDALSADISRLQVAINKLSVQIAELQSEIRSYEARIESIQIQIDEVEQLATQQARELYKSAGTETIDAVLNADSIAELNDRLEMMGVAARENTGALVEYSRLRAEIEAISRDLFEKRRVLDSKLATQQEMQAELDARKDELSERLSRVNTHLTHDRDDAAALLAENKELKAQIIEAQAKSSVAVLGTSNEGFIWPLNGGITSGYGPRWGRMHTGLDLDGYSGQPIVAAKEGSVMMAGSYGGYGTAVTIDHGGGISTLYAHMSGLNTSAGSAVKAGHVIGYVGCTGSCTGDHLHFEVRVGGNPVDPMPYMP